MGNPAVIPFCSPNVSVLGNTLYGGLTKDFTHKNELAKFIGTTIF